MTGAASDRGTLCLPCEDASGGSVGVQNPAVKLLRVRGRAGVLTQLGPAIGSSAAWILPRQGSLGRFRQENTPDGPTANVKLKLDPG